MNTNKITTGGIHLKSVDFRNDPMFLRNQFARDGTFEMPVIKKTKLDLDNIKFVGYDRLSEKERDKIVHFFLDDYKFEVLWKEPEPRIEKLKEYRAVLSPQFSVYTEMPVALQIHQVFKSRWCGAYFQSKGLKVIPSLVWGEPDTFWFSFDGIDEGSVVAVSTIGMRTEKDLFMAGYKEMMRRIRPKAILCYGEPFEEMDGKLIIIDYAKTNNLSQEKTFTKPIVKQLHSIIEKGGGAAGGGSGGSSQGGIPKFPGWDPSKSPGEGYEWRGKGDPGSKTGNWFKPDTGEWLRGDLSHPDPIGPHWDYGIRGTPGGFRIFPDGSYTPKAFEEEGVKLT